MVASKQLTDGVAPPNLHHTRKLRAAQQKLLLNVSPIIKPIMNWKRSDAATKITAKKMAVIDNWVRMTELEEDVDSSKSKVGKPTGKADGDDGKSKTKADGDDNPQSKEHGTSANVSNVATSTINALHKEMAGLCNEKFVMRRRFYSMKMGSCGMKMKH